jgi:hypothetical protein
VVQVAGGTLSSGSLDHYCSVALAGVATEYVRFGQAEGGINDIRQLDSLLRALQVMPLQDDSRSLLQELPCRAGPACFQQQPFAGAVMQGWPRLRLK